MGTTWTRQAPQAPQAPSLKQAGGVTIPKTITDDEQENAYNASINAEVADGDIVHIESELIHYTALTRSRDELQNTRILDEENKQLQSTVQVMVPPQILQRHSKKDLIDMLIANVPYRQNITRCKDPTLLTKAKQIDSFFERGVTDIGRLEYAEESPTVVSSFINLSGIVRFINDANPKNDAVIERSKAFYKSQCVLVSNHPPPFSYANPLYSEEGFTFKSQKDMVYKTSKLNALCLFTRAFEVLTTKSFNFKGELIELSRQFIKGIVFRISREWLNETVFDIPFTEVSTEYYKGIKEALDYVLSKYNDALSHIIVDAKYVVLQFPDQLDSIIKSLFEDKSTTVGKFENYAEGKNIPANYLLAVNYSSHIDTTPFLMAWLRPQGNTDINFNQSDIIGKASLAAAVTLNLRINNTIKVSNVVQVDYGAPMFTMEQAMVVDNVKQAQGVEVGETLPEMTRDYGASWFNSIMQCLFLCEKFRTFLLSSEISVRTMDVSAGGGSSTDRLIVSTPTLVLDNLKTIFRLIASKPTIEYTDIMAFHKLLSNHDLNTITGKFTNKEGFPEIQDPKQKLQELLTFLNKTPYILIDGRENPFETFFGFYSPNYILNLSLVGVRDGDIFKTAFRSAITSLRGFKEYLFVSLDEEFQINYDKQPIVCPHPEFGILVFTFIAVMYQSVNKVRYVVNTNPPEPITDAYIMLFSVNIQIQEGDHTVLTGVFARSSTSSSRSLLSTSSSASSSTSSSTSSFLKFRPRVFQPRQGPVSPPSLTTDFTFKPGKRKASEISDASGK